MVNVNIAAVDLGVATASVSAGVGVAVRRPRTSADDLSREADEARNRCVETGT